MNKLSLSFPLNQAEDDRSMNWKFRGQARVKTLVVKNPPANAGDMGDMCLIPGLGRSPGGGHGNLLQCSCLENSMDRGAWRATVHGGCKESEPSEYLSTAPQRLKL